MSPDPAAAGALSPSDLVGRIRHGDEAAFEAMFRAYLAPLSGFAFRYVGSRDLAADLVQDLFLWIWRNRAGWAVQGSLKAYLYRAVRNRALDAVRHQRIERRWMEQSSGEPFHHSDSADERTEVLERAIAALPERRRQVFLLRYRDGLTYAEIADVMGTTVKTVENQMGRALHAVRQAVGGTGHGRGGFSWDEPS